MQYINKCLEYLLDSEKDSYLEYIESNFDYLLQDDQEYAQCLNINWIKRNINLINHIYMYARLAKEEISKNN